MQLSIGLVKTAAFTRSHLAQPLIPCKRLSITSRCTQMSNFCWRISQCFFIFGGWYPHTGETIYSRFPDSLLYTCFSTCEYPMPVCDSTQSFTMFQLYGYSYSNHNFPHWIDLLGGSTPIFRHTQRNSVQNPLSSYASWLRTGFSSWTMISSNTLVSITPELIINQQG